MATHAKASLDPLEQRQLGPLAGRLTRRGLILAGVGLLVMLLLALVGGEEAPRRVLFAYLANFAFYFSLCLGALLFVMVHFVCKTGTVVNYRRLGEIVGAATPWMALAALPILLAAPQLYRWIGAADTDPIVADKAAYLNYGFWLVRMLLWLAIFSVIGLWYHRTSLKQDETGEPALTLRMQGVGPVGIIVFALAITFFSFDLLKSLDAHWFSTIFGVYYFTGGFLGLHCVLAIGVVWLQKRGLLQRAVNEEHLQDIGKMIFAFVVFWAYIAFSQYMLIWYGNIPEETVWYIRHGGSTDPGHLSLWTWVLLALLVGHFVLPFFGLLSRWIKRDVNPLMFWAVWVLVFHWLDMVWLVRPEMVELGHGAGHGGTGEGGYPLHLPIGVNWVDVLALLAGLVGLGGLFLAAVARVAANHSLVAEKDPRLAEALAFENF